MYITFSSEQLPKTGNLDCNLLLRQNELDILPTFMEPNFIKSKLRQDQIAKVLGCSSFT